MERARVSWTDERLDDLSRRVDAGFTGVDADIRVLSERIDAQGALLSTRIDALGQRVDERFDALQRTVLQVGGGLIAAILATALSVILGG